MLRLHALASARSAVASCGGVRAVAAAIGATTVATQWSTARLPHQQQRTQHVRFSTAAAAPASTAASYSATMLLPRTPFPQHVKSIYAREAALQALCRDTVYEWQLSGAGAAAGSAPFLLHDGPPFANGRLHMGHFMNKVLKDFINRYKMMRGQQVQYVPGWDCHGLPIEVKALELLKTSSGSASDVRDLSAPEVRRLARAFATAAIEEQRKSFRQWGVMGSWEKPYITMDAKYEAAQLGVFASMVERGLIYRGLKPVYWSPVSRTALAEAELEYVDDHVSPSLYVGFPLTTLSPAATAAGLDLARFEGLCALIWTTTPWTLPSNLAISFHNDLDYCVVRVGAKRTPAVTVAPPAVTDKPASKSKDKSPAKPKDASEEGEGVEGSYFLIGADRIAEVVGGVLQREAEVLLTVKGSTLAGCAATHPFYPRPAPFLPGVHVTTEAGTALVHTAPAHGMDDFQVCREHGITEVLCPVDAEGTYTSEIGLPELVGQNVLKGANKHVIALLKTRGHLVHTSKLVHRFPYDWRSKTPVIQRATEQWFCRLEAIQSQALDAVKQVEFVPAIGQTRLQAMIEGRKEWCISRQRHWGVPIPVFYNETDGTPLLTAESVHHIQSIVAQHGTDAWWTMSVEELLAPKYRADGNTYVRGSDTMDVWFDSGCSWRAVVQSQMGHSADTQADVYLEGSDQHRGWFQSSLLTSVAVSAKAPYKTILTHGMVLDENFRKMSKSIGNIIDPTPLIEGHPSAPIEDAPPAPAANAPADGKKKQKDRKKAAPPVGDAVGVDHLRLWVSSTDYTGDVSLGKTVLAKIGDALKKYRASARFMLGCLDGFEPSHVVPLSALAPTDAYLLHLLHVHTHATTAAYDAYNFKEVFALTQAFNSAHLSAFFLDINKDRLYADAVDAPRRRATQTVLLQALIVMVKTMAPVMPHLAEDIYQHVPASLRSFFDHPNQPRIISAVNADATAVDSVFMHGWAHVPAEWQNEQLCARFSTARRVRSHVHKLLESLRQESKLLSNFSEAAIRLEVDLSSGLGRELAALGEQEISLVFNTAVVELAAPSSIEGDSRSLAVSEVDSLGVATPLMIRFQPAEGAKCPRCWLTSPQVTAEQACCARCTQVLLATSK